jgi:hypothetical protein
VRTELESATRVVVKQQSTPIDYGHTWRAGVLSTLGVRRSAELRSAGLLKEGEEIRFVINRMHDGRPLAGKIRSASDIPSVAIVLRRADTPGQSQPWRGLYSTNRRRPLGDGGLARSKNQASCY